MIEVTALERLLAAEGLTSWAACIAGQLNRALRTDAHGEWVRWRPVLDALPQLGDGQVTIHKGALSLEPAETIGVQTSELLSAQLMQLHPWRKGPFRIGGVEIDTEWRSDWKWDRVAPHLAPLDGRLVLDVGCGNGYHCWRMAMAGARRVIGIDPTALFLAQFLAVSRLVRPLDSDLADRVNVLPLGIESVPADLASFDTVFSMGVLYHRRSPVDHLMELRRALRRGGQLVLETLVVEGGQGEVMVPRGRYAKMRNVWFIPSTGLLEVLLRRSGFTGIKTVDINVTSLKEQRSTDWMTFESLADFLDPADSTKTIEGYAAPRRAIVTATAG